MSLSNFAIIPSLTLARSTHIYVPAFLNVAFVYFCRFQSDYRDAVNSGFRLAYTVTGKSDCHPQVRELEV